MKKPNHKRQHLQKAKSKRKEGRVRIDRAKIPDPIKRLVRQKCGFGCIICGQPMLWDYDHIVEYNIVKKHEVENLILLCPNHHREKTNKLLSPVELSMAIERPYNLRHENTSKHELRFFGNTFEVIVGGAKMTLLKPEEQNELIAFVIKDMSIISYRIEESRPLITMRIFNSLGFKELNTSSNNS